MDGREVGVAVQPHIPTTPKGVPKPKVSGTSKKASGKPSDISGSGGGSKSPPSSPIKQPPPLEVASLPDENEVKATREAARLKQEAEKVELAKRKVEVLTQANLQEGGESVPLEGVGFNRGQDVVTMKSGGLGRVIRNQNGDPC